jgi:transposase InsO family protein
VGTRWCSDGLEIACDNGEKVRVAFALDCCDREAMGHVATTGGITAEDVQDLMVATVEHRYGRVNRVPEPIEWRPGRLPLLLHTQLRPLVEWINAEPRRGCRIWATSDRNVAKSPSSGSLIVSEVGCGIRSTS